MAYLLTILAALGLLLWSAPTRATVEQRLGQGAAAFQRIASSSSGPLQQKGSALVSTIRQKGTELLREQLRGVIDSVVR
jgi:hypothetical protein